MCPHCGTRAEWFDPSRGGDRFALIGDTHRCTGCEIKAQIAEQVPEKERGVYVMLVPNPDADLPVPLRLAMA